MQHNFKNEAKFNEMRQSHFQLKTATVSIFESLKLLGKILQKDLNKINESAWCLHSHLLH